RQGTALLVGLRPRDGHLLVQRENRKDDAAHHRARVRRGGRLLARRTVDRVLVDARRLQPAAERQGKEDARGKSELLRRNLHHARRRLRPAAAHLYSRIRRRTVLHTRWLAHPLSALRRDGTPGRYLDDEA